MIDKKKDISFAEFYLIEFFNHTLSKGVEAIPKDNYEILKELSNYLLEEENVIDGLEKLAQYQGTSEFAIFLFDMVDRIQDFSPFMIYSTVPDLAEDFINLYQLMIEDPESISALNSALVLFREKEPKAEPEPVLPEQIEEVSKPEEELISFDEFYKQEIANQFDEALGLSELHDKRESYSNLFSIFKEFSQEKSDSELQAYDPIISEIYQHVKTLEPREEISISSAELMDSLKYNIKQCVEGFKNLEENSGELFQSILSKNLVPEKEIELEEKEPLVSEEIPDKPTTIDDILHDYFKSEVEDHILLIRDELDKSKQSNDFAGSMNEITRQFKSLKEIGMIHGYSGIEHFCATIIPILTTVQEEKLAHSQDTFDVFDLIFVELGNVESYKTGKSDDVQIDEIENFAQRLKDSFKAREPELVQAEPEKIPEIVEKKDDTEEAGELIKYSDKEQLFVITKDLIKQARVKIKKVKKDFDETTAQSKISEIIIWFTKGVEIGVEGIFNSFGTPLNRAYQHIASLQGEEKIKGDELVKKVWTKILRLKKVPIDYSKLDACFEPIWLLGKQEGISTTDDEQISSALEEARKSQWLKIRDKLNSALVKNEESAKIVFKDYFSDLNKNLQLLGYDKYINVVNYISNIIENEKGIVFNEELTQEIDKSFELVLDRIKSQGKTGSCEDILAVLEELIAEIAPQEPPEQIVDVEESEEEDVEKIFVTESQQNIKTANVAISSLNSNLEDRSQFLEIENALHSIRSSAHLMGKSKISDTAAVIEEVAEIFGKSSAPVPDDLLLKLSSGVEDLSNLITDDSRDVEESVNKLQQILDEVVIEDAQTEETVTKETEKEKDVIADEKPLFSEEALDEDMLDIFREEAKDFIATITESNEVLTNEPDNEKALDQMDYASHSLKSAAKMLGFREIGQISDSLEIIVESIKNQEVENTKDIQQNIKNAIIVIDQLSKGEQVGASDIAGVLNALDVSDQQKTETFKPPIEMVSEYKDTEDISDVFLGEATELLEKISADMLELEKMPESETLLTNLLRNLHTLKGSAMMARHENIGELCHKIEDYFDVYKQQNTEIKQDMLNPAFSAFDLIEEVIQTNKSGHDETSIHFTAKLAEIDNKLFLFQNFDLTPEEKSTVKRKTTPAKTTAKKSKEDENVIKITTSYLDNLVNMATELLVNRTELTTYFDDLKKIVTDVESGKKQIYQAENLLEDIVEESVAGNNKVIDGSEKEGESRATQSDEELQNVSVNFKEVARKINLVTSELNKLSQGFERNINRIANISKDLHGDILKARMVPIEQLFSRYPRAVRDMAKEQNKQIELILEDNEAEMDRAMVESLADPILHIIRNAVDHGIEVPKERTSLKKNKKGTITLRASQDKNQIVIDIIDDGRGIDLEKVKGTVVKNKIATRRAVNKLSEAEILDFLFLPEFSTKDKKTDVSGRGIGLNVVSNQIQKLKGIIRLKTEKNIGTSFSIRVPLTLVISQALMIKMQGQNIAIPVVAVQESAQFETNDILMDDDRKYLKVRGKLLPFITLDELLNFDEPQEKSTDLKFALVLHDAGVSMALGVGEITGRQEIVIKALGSHLQNIEYITGGTILGNGEVALILDYASIIRTVEAQFFGRITDSVSSRRAQKLMERKTEAKEQEKESLDSIYTPRRIIEKKLISDRKPRVLVVDDSISVRNFVSSVLEKQGYSTLKSSDGSSAIKQIQKEDIDLVITDLEMPKMHGFQLIEKIRSKAKFKDLPIVILTGKTGQDNRAKAIDLGADAFIMKPFKENDLISVLEEFIELNQ